MHETDLQRAAWDVPHRQELARQVADELLAWGALAYTVLGGRPFGPFYLTDNAPPCYLGDLPEPLVARTLRMWLLSFHGLMALEGIPHPSTLAEVVREELRRRAELGYMPAAPKTDIP